MKQVGRVTGGAMPTPVRITAIGTYLPAKVVTNEDLAKIVETSDQWIVERTGIRERHISGPDEFTSDVCVGAVKDLIARSGKQVDDVDMVLVGTTSPDYYTPGVAAQVQHRLGIHEAGALDLNAACAGFAYGLHLANALITADMHRKILVIGGETMSKITDYKDRNTCVLFADGAGAVLVERDDDHGAFLAAHLGSDGAGGKHLYVSGLSSRFAGKPDAPLIRQNGREVFKWAVSTVTDGVIALTKKAGIALDDVAWFAPHSANLRIIEAICKRLSFPLDRVLCSVEQCGNTSSASIPLALDQAVRDGRLRNGDLVLAYGFGGGLVHAGLLLKWTASHS